MIATIVVSSSYIVRGGEFWAGFWREYEEEKLLENHGEGERADRKSIRMVYSIRYGSMDRSFK